MLHGGGRVGDREVASLVCQFSSSPSLARCDPLHLLLLRILAVLLRIFALLWSGTLFLFSCVGHLFFSALERINTCLSIPRTKVDRNM